MRSLYLPCNNFASYIHNVNQRSPKTLFPFQFRFLIPPYPFIEAFLHLLQKMRVTDGLSPFDVSIESVTVLRFNSKERIEYGSKLFQRDFPVVDASHFMDAVYDFNKVYGIACPL